MALPPDPEPLEASKIESLLGTGKPKSYGHCQTFYELLDSKAADEVIQERNLRVFRGYLTEAFRETSLPIAYYSPVINLLSANECIVTVSKGARGVESITVLLRPPTAVDEWQESFEKPLTGNLQAARLRQDVDALLKSVGGLDVIEALRNIEGRIKVLEDLAGIAHNTS